MSEREKKQARKKTTWAKVGIIFLATMVLLTFLSKSIASLLMPQVEAYQVKNGAIIYSDSCTGNVIYRDTCPIISQASLTVDDLFVQDGQHVLAGTPLFCVDQEVMELEQRTMELEIERLNTQLPLTKDRQSSVQLKEEIDIKKAYLKRFKEINPTNGLFLAPEDGIVTNITVARYAALMPGQTAMTIVNNADKKVVVFITPFEAGTDYATDDRIDATYHAMVTNDKTGVSKLETISLKTIITKKTYLTDTNEWQFEAPFQPDPQEIFEDNVQIELTHQSGNYDMVVPLSCLSKVDGNKAEVFLIDTRQGLFGIETFVKTASVAILEKNNTYAAIFSDLFIPGSMLVNHSTKPLESGKTVSVSQSNVY